MKQGWASQAVLLASVAFLVSAYGCGPASSGNAGNPMQTKGLFSGQPATPAPPVASSRGAEQQRYQATGGDASDPTQTNGFATGQPTIPAPLAGAGQDHGATTAMAVAVPSGGTEQKWYQATEGLDQPTPTTLAVPSGGAKQKWYQTTEDQ